MTTTTDTTAPGVLEDRLVPSRTLKVGDVYRQFAGGEPIVVRTVDRIGTDQTVVGIATRDGRFGTDWLGQFTRKVDITDLPICDTCRNGCNCTRGQAGCEHFCCWGTQADAIANTCPGALRESVALHTRRAAVSA